MEQCNNSELAIAGEAKHAEPPKDPTFESIFFDKKAAVPILVPDYQRAYSWEQKQVKLFINDLKEYQSKKGYYFGHFIVEENQGSWELVDGQQRITTFVLFLMICQVLSPSEPDYTLIKRFSTVSYDAEALKNIRDNLKKFLADNQHFNEQKPPEDDQIVKSLGLSQKTFTRSQRRIVLALLLFNEAFLNKTLEMDKIRSYVDVVMKALCSIHGTCDKSLAASIFEMQNTRGVPLSTIEIIKATLMKFVYGHGGDDCDKLVKNIQDEFGEIYGMEERLALQSFRGEMTMDQLLRLHLRVVDDGTKREKEYFDSPAMNANADALVKYVALRLNEGGGVRYAIDLAKN